MKSGEFISEYVQYVGEHPGYQLTLRGSISYCCEALGLRGYRTETALKLAMTKWLKARGHLP